MYAIEHHASNVIVRSHKCGVVSPPLSASDSSASGVSVCLAGCYNVTAGCAGLAPGYR